MLIHIGMLTYQLWCSDAVLDLLCCTNEDRRTLIDTRLEANK